MAAQGIHHVSLTVTNFDRSKAFYDRLFALLGGQPIMATTGAPHVDPEGHFVLYAAPGMMVGIWEASKENRSNKFDRYNVGLHHVAFAASSREAVDALHKDLVAAGANILDAPAEYPYAPGYYATFFTDPDGIKLEFVHLPG